MLKEEQYSMRAFQLGASAYIDKGAVKEELIAAAHASLEGRRYVTPDAYDGWPKLVVQNHRLFAVRWARPIPISVKFALSMLAL